MTNNRTRKNKLWISAFRCVLHILLLGLLAGAVAAQTITTSSTDGTTPLALTPGAPAGSYALSGLDNINLYNGSLNFRLPLIRVGGRGDAVMAVTLGDFEKHWTVERSEALDAGLLSFVPDPSWWTGLKPGYGPGVLEGRSGGFDIASCDPSMPSTLMYGLTLARLTFTAADGTEYELRDQLSNGEPALVTRRLPCPEQGKLRGKVFITADGSAATFISNSDIADDNFFAGAANRFLPSGDLLLRDGAHYHIDRGLVTWMRDRNGNRLTFTYKDSELATITDSLNRTIKVEYWHELNTNFDRITFLGFAGNQRTILVWYSDLRNARRSDQTIKTYKQLFPNLDGSGTEFNPRVTSKVQLPNGTEYRLYYNSYAELARVELPTGGAIEYDFGPGTGTDPQGVLFGGGNAGIYRRVVERRAYPDGVTLEQRTTFSDVVASVPASTAVTVDHLAAGSAVMSREKHHFFGRASDSLFREATDYPFWPDGREYKTEFLASDGITVLTKQENTWEQRAAVTWWIGSQDAAPPNDPRLKESATTLSDTNQVSKRRFTYDRFNNRTLIEEFDYGAGVPPTSPIRRTEIDYVTVSDDNGLDYSDNPDIHIRSLIKEQRVFSTGTTPDTKTHFHYDQFPLVDRPNIVGYGPPPTAARGDPTTVERWLNTTGGWITSTQKYDIAGSIVERTDPRGNTSQTDYSPAGNAFAFPLVTRTPVPDPTGQRGSNTRLETFYNHDFSSGLLISITDPAGQVTSAAYNDPLDRLTLVVRPPGGGQTAYTYSDTPGNLFLQTQTIQTAAQALVSTKFYDGLGRVIKTSQSEGSTSIQSDTEYDALGRVSRVSNPYRPSETPLASRQWTTAAYDALSRIVSVTSPDSAVVTTSYSGNKTTVTDQAGRLRRSVADGLGRLVRVDEPDSNNDLGLPDTPAQPTSYSYDALDDLVEVTQGSQAHRRFVYDSLKRLTSATNPESGTVSYQYDANGNLTQKTDARGVITTYLYDAINRITTRSYSDGTPTVSYVYDSASVLNSKGRLTSESSSVSTYSYGEYDAMGRLKTGTQTTAGQSFTMSYSYDFAGNMISETYPSQRVVTQSYDLAARLSGVSGQKSGQSTNYASSFQYAPHRGVKSVTLGNGLVESTSYNERLQPASIALGTLFSLTYKYGVMVGAALDATKNNGNVESQEISVGGTAIKQSYLYDELNRLKSVSEAVGGAARWTQQYGYDRYGNRATLANTGTEAALLPTQSTPMPDLANNNRLAGFTYDAAGNVLLDGAGNSFTYDAENHQTSHTRAGSTTTYTYDGDGRRVKKEGGGVTTLFVYNVSGQLIAEYDNSGTRTGATSYLTTDHLGSTRVVTKSDGTVKVRYDYCPFGEELGAGIGGRTTGQGYGADDATRQKFTQKERDSESGLDYFLARYYSAPQGRFASADIPFADQKEQTPQSWNLYSYTRNNPTNYVDPNGNSTHTNKDGVVVAVYDDGDLGVYRHDDLRKWDQKSTLPTTGKGVSLMGETPFWDEFRAHDNKTGAILPEVAKGARIMFGQRFDEDVDKLNADARKMDLTDVAANSTLGKKFDIKNDKTIALYGPNTGKTLGGYFVTARSAGNYLAGYNGATAKFRGDYLDSETYMKMAGAAQQGQWSKVTAAKILLFGTAYGPAPYYGEIEYSGRQIARGFYRGESERGTKK